MFVSGWFADLMVYVSRVWYASIRKYMDIKWWVVITTRHSTQKGGHNELLRYHPSDVSGPKTQETTVITAVIVVITR